MRFLAFSSKDYGADAAATAPTLRAMNFAGSHANAGGQITIAANGAPARRLTPVECERLQALPDGYTNLALRRRTVNADSGVISRAAAAVGVTAENYLDAIVRYQNAQMEANGTVRISDDGPRYRSIGNTFAVLAVAWIGERINTCAKEVHHD